MYIWVAIANRFFLKWGADVSRGGMSVENCFLTLKIDLDT